MEKGSPGSSRLREKDLEALLEFFETPAELWKKLRSTNIIELLFVEVRRRIRTTCAFTLANHVKEYSTAFLTE
jgi:transposase-like protein